MLAITVDMLVLYFVFRTPTRSNYLLIASLMIGLIGVFSERKVTWVWEKIAHILGTFNSYVLLTAIFFIFLTPVAFLFKLTRKDNLKLKAQKGSIYENTIIYTEPKIWKMCGRIAVNNDMIGK